MYLLLEPLLQSYISGREATACQKDPPPGPPQTRNLQQNPEPSREATACQKDPPPDRPKPETCNKILSPNSYLQDLHSLKMLLSKPLGSRSHGMSKDPPPGPPQTETCNKILSPNSYLHDLHAQNASVKIPHAPEALKRPDISVLWPSVILRVRLASGSLQPKPACLGIRA